MILVGSQRGGALQLAAHLTNDRDNDHVTVHEVRGFATDDLRGAFAEAQAISKGTQCRQFLFSCSLNPPKEARVCEEDFEKAADRIEKRLGLEGQPRAIVFHEKEGRRHAHVVWSRIDAGSMTAINLSFFKSKLKDLSRELHLDHEWSLPDGLRRDGGKSPLNFTLAEWQQAKRLELDPREIKQSFQEAWARSDSQKAFANALEERGYFLAKGDRRGFVALDVNGEVFSVARYAGVKTKEVRERLSDADGLRSVDETKALIAGKLSQQLRGFVAQVKDKQAADKQPLDAERLKLRDQHRAERRRMAAKQKERQAQEAAQRLRLRTGVAGLWDRVSGRAATIRNANETAAWQAHLRDQKQRDALICAQLDERQALQKKIESLRRKQREERKLLAREIGQAYRRIERPPPARGSPGHEHERGKRPFDLDLTR